MLILFIYGRKPTPQKTAVPGRQNQSSFLFTPWPLEKMATWDCSGRRAFSRASRRRRGRHTLQSACARLTLAVAARRAGGPPGRRGSADPNQPSRSRGPLESKPLRVDEPPELTLRAALRHRRGTAVQSSAQGRRRTSLPANFPSRSWPCRTIQRQRETQGVDGISFTVHPLPQSASRRHPGGRHRPRQPLHR